MKDPALQQSYANNTSINYPKLYRYLRIFIFESLSTLLFTYGIMCTQYEPIAFGSPSGFQPILNPFHSLFISAAMFLCFCFAGQLTGAHINPAVTCTFLMNKKNKITIPIAFVYILSQFIGGIIGGMIVLGVFPIFYAPTAGYYDDMWPIWRTFLAQLVGSFMFCLFMQIVVNHNTTFIKSNMWNYVLISFMYYVARQFTGQINGLNPATVLPLQLVFGIKYGNWQPLSTYWVYLIAPIIASILASFFFMYFYLPLFFHMKRKSQ